MRTGVRRMARGFAAGSAAYSDTVMSTISKAPALPKAVLAAALAETAAYVGYGMTGANTYSTGAMTGMGLHAEVKARIRATYGYVAGGLALTGVVATAFWRSGMAMRFMTANPWLQMGALIAGMLGTGMWLRSTPYESTFQKHLALGAFNSVMGVWITGLVGFLPPAIILQAAMCTGMVVGGLSLFAFSARNDLTMQWGPYLGVGSGLMIAACLGSMFFPGSMMLHNFIIYGGVGLYGCYLAFDTQRMIAQAKLAHHYDPINAGLGIYMNTLQLFWRIAWILANSNTGGSKKK